MACHRQKSVASLERASPGRRLSIRASFKHRSQAWRFLGRAVSGGRFGCALVTDLRPAGVGSRTTLVAGLFDWVGASLPAARDLRESRVFAQGLTRIEAITRTGAKVRGRVPLPEGLAIAPNYRDYRVGTVHKVWGWKVLGRLIEERLADEGKAVAGQAWGRISKRSRHPRNRIGRLPKSVAEPDQLTHPPHQPWSASS